MNFLCWMTLKNIANRTTSIVLDGSSNIWRKHWPKTKDNLHLDDMKTYRISAVHAEMLKTLSRKLRMKEEEVIEEMIQERYNQKKWHEQPPRPKRLGTTSVQPISAVGRDSSNWLQHVSDLLLTEGPLGEEDSNSWGDQLGVWRSAPNDSCGASDAPGKDQSRHIVLKTGDTNEVL